MNHRRILTNPKLEALVAELFFAQPISRDKLPYSDHFEEMYKDFCFRACPIKRDNPTRRDFWLAILGIGKRRKLARGKEQEQRQEKRAGGGIW